MTTLPDSVLNLAENVPAEDIALAILREGFPDVDVLSLVARDQTFPFLLVRRLPSFIDFRGDVRFLESLDLAVHAYAQGVDGDQDAAILSEAARVVLRNAWQSHWYDPDLGSISHFEVLSPARRTADWATASGPVQYADLPSNAWRYEARYRLIVRKPRVRPFQVP